MAEDRESEGGGQPFQAFDTVGAAIAVALDKAGSGRQRDSVDAFLEDQRTLIAKQLEGFEEQQRHLRLKHWSERIRLTLQVLTLVVGLGVAGVLGAVAWQAYHDHGLVVEAFSVPPDLVARGMTGQIVGSRLLDKLADMQD